MTFLSDTLIVKYDRSTKSLLILHPDTNEFAQPLVNIREETYSAMTLDEASEFIGARILLLIPEMRQQFKEEIARLASSEHGKKQSPK
jgi:hypothetical protein